MAPRRGPTPASSSNSLALQPSSPSLHSFPRAGSPSGISSFFTKPARWFGGRTNSNPRLPSAEDLPRPSFASSRKLEISPPTDPRPIPSSNTDSSIQASRSVLDVSVVEQISVRPPPPGDLRNISRKNWSRSMDDLSNLLSKSASAPLSVNTSFSQQARIDAYRSNSPSSPHEHLPKSNLPFPTITTSSSSPPGHSHWQTSSTGPSLAPPSAHVHIRSHSHTTSALSSKPSTTSLFPTNSSGISDSPRKASPMSLEKPTGAFSGLGGFAFHFGAKSATNLHEKPPPPVPTAPVQSPSQRASQIVYHSGFLNRHPTPTSPSALSSQRGWKSFKAELRGSKLYFYKPPHERAAGIKELFPLGLAPPVEYEGDQEDGPVEPADEGRRKRAFWGPGRHPEMSADADGRIFGGSSQALIYEMVFGTTFFLDTKEDQWETSSWRDYAEAILLSLPPLMGRSQFEAEFKKFAGHLISPPEIGTKFKSRVVWLIGRYEQIHRSPQTTTQWNEWKQELHLTVPSSPSSSLPSSPALADSALTSPKTLFPRATDYNSIPETSQSNLITTKSKASILNFISILGKQGLTREIFLQIDNSKIVRSFIHWNQSLLPNAKQAVAAEVVSSVSTGATMAWAAFGGSEARPHWLTRLIIVQILGPSGSSSRSTYHLNGDHSHSGDIPTITPQTSRTHNRALTVSKWIQVGELCRRSGDECAWRAIVEGLCSKPIARLDKVWKRVDIVDRHIVEAWSRGMKFVHKSRKIIPWTGDIIDRVGKLKDQARVKDEEWRVAPLQGICDTVNKITQLWETCISEKEPKVEADEEVLALANLWRELSSVPGPKNTDVNQYLAISFAAEPIQRGRFASCFWKPRPAVISSHPFAALIFPEALPNITFLDSAGLVRSKKDSLDGISMDVKQIRRITRMISITSTNDFAWDGKELDAPDLGETFIQLFDGELVLRVSRESPSPLPSRPPSTVESAGPSVSRSPSRTPSIRVSSSAASTLERKTSAARRSSLPSLSQRGSHLLAEPSTTAEGSIRVVIHCGTLDRLVNILISGLEGVSVAVADDNGEMPLREDRIRNVRLDREDFARIWWSVFRSFVTPIVLFELLHKRFLSTTRTLGESESWDHGSTRTRETDQTSAVRTRLDIFSTLTEWLDRGSGAQDMLDNIELYDAFKTFLYDATAHNLATYTNSADYPAVTELAEARKTLISLFTSQTLRPILKVFQPQEAGTGPLSQSFGRNAPDVDAVSPEQLVESLDAIGATAFRTITNQDFLAAADILEVQSADRTGWFLSSDPNSLYEEVIVPTFYSHVQLVEPSPLITELEQDSLYKLLPPTIRGAIRAHSIVRHWILVKIAVPGLGIRLRQNRMELFLRALQICRIRSCQALPTGSDPIATPLPRSFVEAVITSAFLSPESRTYNRAWQNVAFRQGTSIESLSSLLSNMATTTAQPVKEHHLTVDVAWLLERLLEIITLTDTIPSQDGQNLINLDKRRHLCNIVLNTASLAPPRSPRQHIGMDQVDIERMNSMHRESSETNMDPRIVRDDAYRENSAAPPLSAGKRHYRPFQKHVFAQQDKIKRDKHLRDRLSKEKRMEQLRSDKRENDLNKAMNPISQGSKHQKGKRSMSAFFRVVRPLSTAWSADKSMGSMESLQGRRRTAAELDFVPNTKPSLVLDLGGSRVKAIPNDQRSFIFQLDTEDGGHYLLQSTSGLDMSRWINAIVKISHSAAEKRLTYIGNALPQPEPFQDGSKSIKNRATAVYGVDLEFLIRRENGGQSVEGTIPKIVEKCLTEVEARGMTEVGIYRISGTVTAINNLKAAFDNGENVDMNGDDAADINAVCGALKAWFRQLPGGLFPGRHYYDCVAAMGIPEFDTRLQVLRDVVFALPSPHFHLLKRLMEHLERVTDFSDQNQMTSLSLAIVFGPSIISVPGQTNAMTNLTFVNQLTRTLISHFHVVFADPDHEIDAEEEEDGEGFFEGDGVLEDLAEEDEQEDHRGDKRISMLHPDAAVHDHDPDLEPLPTAPSGLSIPSS